MSFDARSRVRAFRLLRLPVRTQGRQIRIQRAERRRPVQRGERLSRLPRLPTAAEWASAAEAGGKQPKKDYNCRLEQGGQVLKGSSVLPVNTGKPNGWGLFHYVGNVQEWVSSGAGVTVRGGAFQDSFSKCDISLERPHDGTPDEVTGFRVVRELG